MGNIEYYKVISGRQVRDDGSLINLADIAIGGTTPFNQQIVVHPTQQFFYKSIVPISTQRDVVTVTGDGTISQVNNSEYQLKATNGTAQFQTKQIGDYMPFSVLVPGIGLRTQGELTGNARILWGYFEYLDGSITNGTLIEYNADGIFHKVFKGGLEVYSEKIDADVEKGLIYQFPFAYYGYLFAGLDIVERNQQGVLIANRKSNYSPDGETMMNNSNLPLTVRLEADGEEISAFTGGRHITTLGKNEKSFRTVTEIRKLQGGIGSTDLYPMLSMRVKEPLKNIFCQIADIQTISDADMELAIILNGTLTGASFVAPSNYLESETATEWDKSATGITGGQQIGGALLDGGGGNNQPLTDISIPDRPLVFGDTVTFCIRKLSGTNATATMLASAKENW